MDKPQWNIAMKHARNAANGEETAWVSFIETAYEPLRKSIDRLRFLNQLISVDDARNEVVLRTLEKLRENDFGRLRTFFARSDQLSLDHRIQSRTKPALFFRNWMIGNARRTAVDCLRATPEFLRGRQQKMVEFVALTTGNILISKDEHTIRLTAQRLLAHLDESALGHEHDQYRPALELWLHGYSPAEIAEKLGLESPERARRMVRAAKAVLRRYYGNEN